MESFLWSDLGALSEKNKCWLMSPPGKSYNSYIIIERTNTAKLIIKYPINRKL